MPNPASKTPLNRFAAYSLGGLSSQELGWLLTPSRHIALLSARRAEMILTRVRLVAIVFAVLTPLWTFVDLAVFEFDLWLVMAIARAVATIGFASLFFYLRKRSGANVAHRGIWMLFAIPTLFYLYSSIFLEQHPLTGLSSAVAASLSFLPFLMLAGMSIFPLTAIESVALAAPILAAKVWVSLLHWPPTDWPAVLGVFWLLIMNSAVAGFSSVSQLAFIIVLVRQAIRDPLTGCFSRRSGEELLELQFIQSERAGTPLSVAFLDLDNFKQINDQFGHEAGDKVLRQSVEAISGRLRTGDVLCRWGGEEFVLIMPNTDCGQALVALERLRTAGFGARPDGSPQTASIGVSERIADRVGKWRTLLELADARMYRGKQSGKNRVIAGDH